MRIKALVCIFVVCFVAMMFGVKADAIEMEANMPFILKTRVDTIKESSFTAMEAFCVDKETNIAYCIKLDKKDRTLSRLYKVDLKDNTVTVMTNKEDGSDVIEGLGHANDMDIVTVGQRKYLYIVTMNHFEKEGVTQTIMRLTINDRKDTWKMKPVWESEHGLSGIAYTGTLSNGNMQFLVKNGFDIYTLELNSRGTGIAKEPIMIESLALEGCRIEGQMFAHINERDFFLKQGLSYNNGKIYIPMWERGTSNNYIYVFDIDLAQMSCAYNEKESFSIKLTGMNNIEIEGIEMFDDGGFFFNCNAVEPIYVKKEKAWMNQQGDFVGYGKAVDFQSYVSYAFLK